MSYNLVEKKNYMQTAGKITIAAALSGVMVFAFTFLFNVGKSELMKVEAQTATTTITVLNTPPQWITLAYEQFESSSSTPINSGSNISWVALADNSGNAPYFLLICSTNATPAPAAAASLLVLGTAPPSCVGGTQWGVSTATAALAEARVSTTTREVAPFAGEVLPWFAWVCDDDPVNPRCNNTFSQGLNATNSSPFHVNFRPTLSAATSTSPLNPGAVLNFTSTSGDGNIVRGPDNIFLYVCVGNDFNPTTLNCPSGLLASSTSPVSTNAGASFTLPSVVRDDIYFAYTFIVDQYNHVGTGGFHGTDIGYTVNNVAPTVAPSTISLNGGLDMSLAVPAGQTTGFTLSFITSDANSCLNSSSGSEIKGYSASVLRSGVGIGTCNGSSGSYNPNNCYPSGAATTTWNLSCTASSTSCTGATDPTVLWSCTFPLWFVADPTDSSSFFFNQAWTAAIAGVDDNNATGTTATASSTVSVISFPAIDLLTSEIPYGALEPGGNTGTLTATTTIQSVGNTGLDQNLQGESMCPTFSTLTECVSSASSTIPEFQQRFATSSVSYGSGASLSSTTPQFLRIGVRKSTSTVSFTRGVTYWGIGVPGTITLSGAYTGLNTFYAVTSASSTWY